MSNLSNSDLLVDPVADINLNKTTKKSAKPRQLKKAKEKVEIIYGEINPVTGKRTDPLWDETLKLTQINLDLYGAARYGRELKSFRKARITGPLMNLFGGWYYRFHFAGLKNQIPTLSMIQKSWPQFEQYLRDNPQVLQSLANDSLAKRELDIINQPTVNEQNGHLSGINSLIGELAANNNKVLQMLRRLS